MASEWNSDLTAAGRDEVLLYYPPVDHPTRGRTHAEWVKVGRVGDTPFRQPTHWMPLPPSPGAA